MTKFIEISNKTYINRDQVISVKYAVGGLWWIHTTDGRDYECREERAIKVLLYGDVKMADQPLNASAIAERREPDAFEVFDDGYNPDKRIEPTAQPQPNVDWVAQAKAIISSAYRKAESSKDDCWFICRDVYATVRPTGVQNYTIILRTSHIVSYAETVGSIIVNPITGEKKAAIKNDLALSQKGAIDELVTMLPTN